MSAASFQASFPLPLPVSSVRPSRFAAFLRDTFSAVNEGLELAERYNQLARKTDAELASIGLKRQDLMQVAYFGRAT